MENAMKMHPLVTVSLTLALAHSAAFAVTTTRINNGNLVMQDVPEIPASIVASLNRYQNTRSARFLDWTEDGSGIFIKTRFGDVSQVHHVGHPGGTRRQITFFDEPVGSVQRHVRSSDQFQVYTGGAVDYGLNPGEGLIVKMLSDVTFTPAHY